MDGYEIVFFDTFEEVQEWAIDADQESLFLLDDFDGELYEQLAKQQPPLSMMGPAVFYEKFTEKKNEFSFEAGKVSLFRANLIRANQRWLYSWKSLFNRLGKRQNKLSYTG